MGLLNVLRFQSLIAVAIQFFLFFSLLTGQIKAGILDPTFGTDGKTTTDFPFSASLTYSSNGTNIFVQPSGRIVGVGIHSQSGADGSTRGVTMAGLTSAGAIDPSFSGGKTIDWNSAALTGLSDVHMLTDGRILRLSTISSLFGTRVTKLIRTNTDGSTDSFSPDLTINGTLAFGLKFVVLDNGKILVLLFNQTGYFSYYLVKLNSDGSRDTTFGNGGEKEIVRLSNTLRDPFVSAMQVLPNGKIVIAGPMGWRGATEDFAEYYILRLDPNGNADRSFGNIGLAKISFGGQRVFSSALIIQPDGKYIMAGGIKNPDTDALLVRFTQRGRIDFGFGSAGKVVSDFSNAANDYFSAAANAPGDKIIVAGQASNATSTGFTNFLVARYSADGIFEASTQTSFTASQNSGANSLIIQPDEKILVIGFTKNPDPTVNGNVFAFARYTSITND